MAGPHISFALNAAKIFKGSPQLVLEHAQLVKL